ncbi:hypothetical protein F5972_08165 [Microbispora cellulosiformans]|uniref:Uncharacterized protein n=1 Tax=Microbispora cellulosiformans TaxID=2614688 RepID=A0A5J5K4U4_9ACTN|nr:hypothetical protein [Microbispora cellulosiformans]KAA9379621.1 hypothetical protein F5972_08165 [Microbispora cellulosiformans]
MSGCCGPGPVIMSGPQAPRVDVETVLLCDVLPDGTVASTVLVEPVYDTSSGDRVGTRTVDPTTGAAYTVQGTLRDCAAAGEDCDQFIGALCYQEPSAQDPTFTLHKFDDADPSYPGCLVGLDAMDGDLPFIQYNDPITAWEGVYTSNTGTASNVEVSAPELGGFIDWSTFSPPIPSVPNAGIPAPYTGTAVVNGITVTLEIFTASAITTGTQYLRMGGTEHFKLSFSSPVTMKFGTQGFADPAAGNFERFCNVTATGVVTGTGEIRTAYGLRDCKTGETTWRDQVSGDEVDLTQAVVVPCPQQQRDCASPTTPTATIGLCLPDGTPIAVTVVRDCDGVVTSEGWINLQTGAYSAGAPPVGAVACGSSQSVQVSGTFCDVLADGTVAGLVLIEYSYAADGTIASVRLVDATTGGTYTPTGTITTCPAGVEQPEQDIVQLCDVAADGTTTPFIRDYRRDELGAITGHTDYTLAGAPYSPTGTVGVCHAECRNSSTVLVCDVPAATSTDIPTTIVDSNVAAVGQTQFQNHPGPYTSLWAGGTLVYPAGPGPAQQHLTATGQITADVSDCEGASGSLTISVRVRNNGPDAGQSWDGALRLFRGTTALDTDDALTWAPAGWQGTLTVSAPVTAADIASGDIRVALILETYHLGAKSWTADQFDVTLALEGCEVTEATQFLRTVTTDCVTGEVVSTTDTTLDGAPYTVTGEVGQCTPAETPSDCRDCTSTVLCDVAADGTSTTFLRTVCRDCTGAVVSVLDTDLGGTAPYGPSGTVGICQPAESCLNCETVLLCDDGAEAAATITGLASSGTLPNGVGWTARGSGAAFPAKQSNADGSWWGQGTFPNPILTNTTWTFDRPVDVEFSVELHYFNYTDPAQRNAAQLPVGAVPVSLPTGYSYNAATGVLTGDSTLTDCTALTDPHQATSARFRLPKPVTTFSLQYLGARVAACGVFDMWRFGSVTVTPPGQFLRRICRDCDGAVTSVTDTALDGVTPYTLIGAAKVCTDPEPEDCCQAVQVCIADTVTETVEFVSNEAQVYDNSVDTVWTWTPNGDTNGPAAAATWYQTYRARFAPNPAAWSVVDTAASRPAGWIAPHPGGLTGTTGTPGEGPTLNGPEPWWARASFSLPAAADPDSIQVQITVLNADQQAIRFRLNNGAWQAMPASATHNGTPYTFGPGTLAGAQPGTNTLYFEVNETLADSPSNGAGVMAHFIVTYAVPSLGQRSWTRMVCCDGSVYYLDENGDRQDELPPSSSLVACGGSPDPLVLCDDNGTFLRHVSYVGDQVITTDTDVNGTAYTPTGAVRSCGAGGGTSDACSKQVIERCGCDDTTGDGIGDVLYTELWAVDPCGTDAPVLLGTYEDGDPSKPYTPASPVECTVEEDAAPTPLSTGVRAVNGTAVQDIAGSFPGLQSVSLTVLAGTVNVTMTDGSAVPIPAGVTMTWSVAKDEDPALAAASFAGASAAAQYLLNYTYR